MRVTIDIQYDILKWIAHKAIDLGIPRKEYLELCVLAWYERETENGSMTPESVHVLNKPKTPEESFEEIVETKLNKELDKIRDEQSNMSHLPLIGENSDINND